MIPEAERLAEWLEHELDPEGTIRFVAATELRRLHAENQQLREDLKTALEAYRALVRRVG